MSAGKRGPVGPLVNTSDEDSDPDSPRSKNIPPPLEIKIPSPSPLSCKEHDHDYDNVSSPSSTASGPTYDRKPGFIHHAHKFVIKVPNRVKKKKLIQATPVLQGDSKRLVPPHKPKHRREPLPMRKRALPQSFWQQPNVPHSISPAHAFPSLPPLTIKDTGEEVTAVRPITPPPEVVDKEVRGKKEPPPKPERKITIANTDLLFKLFDRVEKEKHKPSIIKRGRHLGIEGTFRTSKVVPTSNKSFVKGEDPYLMDAVSQKLFPQLSLESTKAQSTSGHSSVQLVTLRQGDKTVTLPSLSIEQNYSQMLSELVMHI